MTQQSSSDQYEAPEEPLQNAEKQVNSAINDLGSSNWQIQFEACNIIKRAALFHKPLFSNNHISGDVFKSLVKPLDSLRSQVSKNASLALYTLYNELGPKECDPWIEAVTPTLLKRAIDTNHFISESAENALI